MISKTTRVTDDVIEAALALKAGGLVAFPTETVFGLGADALNAGAVQSIFEAKGRPADNPLIVHVADTAGIDNLARSIPSFARELVDAFFPGPLSLVLPKRDLVPDATTAGLDTVAIRMPDHEIALEFIRSSERFVAAPSANRSGRPSPTTWEAVFSDLTGRIDVVLKGNQSRVGLESTVVDCSGSKPIILRPGSISLEDLQLVVSTAGYSTSAAQMAQSPGTRHKHYQPEANVVLISHPNDIPTDLTGGDNRLAYIGLEVCPEIQTALVVADVKEYAHHIFSFFRACEKEGVSTIFCQAVPRTGMGWALMDRLERASAG